MSMGILTSFLNAAAKYEMPVKFLWRVINDYDIQFKSGYGTDNVSQFWNEMRLYEGTWTGLRRSTLADSSSVLNLYHEATHAVMDIDDVSDYDWFRDAQLYYSRAKLANGD
jgi:hypothetical protein